MLFDLGDGLYRTEGMAFEIAADQFPRSYRSRLYFDIYEAPERVLVRKWLPKAAAVLELGGCIGVLSCTINRLMKDPNQHIVIEANSTLLPILERNRISNRCSFKIEGCVVSRAAHADFYLAALMTASGKDLKTGHPISVPTKTVEQLEEDYDVSFNTLVIDIEGGEFEFLTENSSFLSKLEVAIIEMHRGILSDNEIDRCVESLLEAGLEKVDELEKTQVWRRPPAGEPLGLVPRSRWK